MALEFGIEDRRVGDDTQVISVRGEIDLFTAPEFKQHVMAPVAAGVERVIVDLTETSFIDSSSLGVLIGANRRLKARGGRLLVACAEQGVVKTFKVTGLDGVFPVLPTLDEALARGAEAEAA